MIYLSKLKKLAGEIKIRPLQYVIMFLMVFCALVFFFQSSDASYPRHGDIFTDAASIIAAKNLVKYGADNLKYALLFSNPPKVDNFTSPLLYLHHPSLPTLILAFFYYCGASTSQARIFPLLMSATGLLATYLLGKKLFSNSWGWGIMLTIAAAAPFRLLSDQFYIVPYVFIVKAWAFFAIASACLAPINARKKWYFALGILGFIAMSVAGWESLLPLGIFSVTFPFFFIKETNSYKIKLIMGLATALTIGLLFGGLVTAIQHIWVYGGFEPAFQDIKKSFLLRTSSSPLNIIEYVVFVCFRFLRLYPLQVLVIFPFLPIILRAMKLKNGFKVNNDIVKFTLILLVTESVWYVIFKQHTFEHDHTASLLLFTIGFSVTLGIKIFFDFIKVHNFSMRLFVIPITGLWIASFFNLGVTSLDGNVQVDSEKLKDTQQQVDFLTSGLNKNDVLILDTTNYYYMYQSYALYQTGQLFVEPENIGFILQNKKLTVAEPLGKEYNRNIGKYFLTSIVPPIAIFDPLLPPGPLNQIYQSNEDNFAKTEDRDLSLLALFVSLPDTNLPQDLNFSFIADEQRTLSFMVAQPLEIIRKGLSDGVVMDFILIENNTNHHLTTVTLGPSDQEWVPVEIVLPAHSQDAVLRISISCGLKDNCIEDKVFLAPTSAH